ncbi:tetratricopeptide repeat protein [Roseibium sp.]|uniref:tetratricopeptide repeat protein n=1 Tax=Roseibium sp. TaxID=1936156 RepID=UPI003D0F5349
MTAEKPVSTTDKLAALERVLASSSFDNSERLKSFLTYVVKQEIDDSDTAIRGKQILKDVYAKDVEAERNSEAVVRVDATRLRQKLEVYYSTDGEGDPVRIQINKGGYTPRFVWSEGTQTRIDEPKTILVSRGRMSAAVAIVGLLTGILYIYWPERAPSAEASSIPSERRTALFETAPTALLARNLSEEAREMLFPAAQLIRVSAALDIFEDAMELDPNYYGSFAGASQASAVLAGMSPEPATRARHMQNAEKFAERAIYLDPTRAWAHSAKAFMLFVKRDYTSANEASLRAIKLEPDNRHTLEIDAIIALFSGHFERAITSADPQHHENRRGSGLPWRNALGNTYFHLGNYDQSIKHLNAAIKSGDPVSEINTAHLIASYQASGDEKKAQELVKAFENSWPDSRLSSVLRRIFANQSDAENVLSRMKAAGWTDPAIAH